jgi:hypothetical protein
MWMSLSACARHRGVARNSVQHQIHQGTIVPDARGMIDSDAADAARINMVQQRVTSVGP